VIRCAIGGWIWDFWAWSWVCASGFGGVTGLSNPLAFNQ